MVKGEKSQESVVRGQNVKPETCNMQPVTRFSA